tara:strand:+ start:4090 stop:4431 length:342 start_codon:yes stop_codon:yes gene_type:complete
MSYETDYYTNAYLVLEGYEKAMIPSSQTKALVQLLANGVPTVIAAPVKLAGLFNAAPPTQPSIATGAQDTAKDTGGTSECDEPTIAGGTPGGTAGAGPGGMPAGGSGGGTSGY